MKKLMLFSALVFSVFLVVGCGDGSGPKFSDSEAVFPDEDNENETTDDLISDEDSVENDETSDVTQDEKENSDQHEVKDDEEVDDEISDPDKNNESPDIDEVPDDGPECTGTELKCEGTVIYTCDNESWIVEKDCLDEQQICRNGGCFTPGVDDPRLDFTGPHFGGDTILVLNASADGETFSYSGTLSAGVVANPEVKKIEKIPFQTIGLRPPVPDLGKPLWLSDNKKRPKPLAFSVGDTENFYVYNFSSGSFDLVTAELKYSGTKVEIWLMSGVTFSDENIQAVAQEFETNIYDLVTTNFYDPPDIDGNGKVTMFLGDLNGGGGYVTDGDFYTKDQNQYSNFKDLIYIGVRSDLGGMNNVIAHEFQHLCHGNRNLLVEGDWNSNNMSYIWINEGLSMASGYLYYGIPPTEDYILNSPAYTSIRDGNSFIYWDTTDSDKISSDYAMTYLFFQYLRIQAGGDPAIYRDIIECTANDYTCVEDVIKSKVDPTMDFRQFLTNFRIALLFYDATGPYGFGGDEDFEYIMKYFTGASASLRGGGGLYINSDSLFTKPADAGENTVFVGIMTGDGEMPDDGDVDDSDIDDGDVTGTDEDTEIPDEDTKPVLTSIYDINQTGTDNMDVVFRGIVTAREFYSFYIQTDPDEYDPALKEKYSGVFVYIENYPTTFNLSEQGDFVEVYGKVSVAGQHKEIYVVTNVVKLGSKPLPEPLSISPSAVQSFEYDGVFVDVGNVTVTEGFNEYYSFKVTDSLIIDSMIYRLSPAPQIGEVYSIKGVMKYWYGAHRVFPRSASDVIKQ